MTSTCVIARICEFSSKPFQFFVTRDRSKCLISLESADRELQKYLFSFPKFCFIVERIEFFPHSVAKLDKRLKSGLVFSGFYYHSQECQFLVLFLGTRTQYVICFPGNTNHIQGLCFQEPGTHSSLPQKRCTRIFRQFKAFEIHVKHYKMCSRP